MVSEDDVRRIAGRDALIAASPEKFFTTPHYPDHPSVLVRLGAVDESELAELLAELLADAWDTRATERFCAGQAGTVQAGTERAGTGQAGTGQASTGQASTGQAGTAQANTQQEV